MSENKTIESVPTYFGRLGKEIKLSPKSHVSINEAGLRVEYTVETISIKVMVDGKVEGVFIMPKESWLKYKESDDNILTIETEKEFNEKHI